MPEVGVGLAVERDVVDPHVEVRPVNADEKHQAAQRRIPSSPRQDEADADANFHDTGDEHPNGWVAENRRDNRLKPGGVGEVLDADIDIHASKKHTQGLQRRSSHIPEDSTPTIEFNEAFAKQEALFSLHRMLEKFVIGIHHG